VTTTDFQVPLDGVARDRELPCEESHRRSCLVLERETQEVSISEFGISTTPLIDGLGDWFNVLRVDTQPDPAQMVRLQTFGPRAYALLPDRSVSHDAVVSYPHLTVSSFPNRGSRPHPTGTRVSTVLDTEVSFVNQSDSFGHTSTPYMTLSMRVELEGYET
jgi:hypothetical protein